MTDEPVFCLESPPNTLWTIGDIAREYGVDVKTVLGWRSRGWLPKTWKRGMYYAPEQVRDKLANRGITPIGDGHGPP
jgi:hypothetical protein